MTLFLLKTTRPFSEGTIHKYTKKMVCVFHIKLNDILHQTVKNMLHLLVWDMKIHHIEMYWNMRNYNWEVNLLLFHCVVIFPNNIWIIRKSKPISQLFKSILQFLRIFSLRINYPYKTDIYQLSQWVYKMYLIDHNTI